MWVRPFYFQRRKDRLSTGNLDVPAWKATFHREVKEKMTLEVVQNQ
jgi:hypothetical protein